jgi:hypothetical protein
MTASLICGVATYRLRPRHGGHSIEGGNNHEQYNIVSFDPIASKAPGGLSNLRVDCADTHAQYLGDLFNGQILVKSVVHTAPIFDNSVATSGAKCRAKTILGLQNPYLP